MGASIPSHHHKPKPDRGTTALTRNDAPVPANSGYVQGPGTSFELANDYSSMMCVPTTVFINTAEQMQVLAFLRLRASLIAAAEQKFRVDRRAIAGVIAWEALKNPHPASRVSVGLGKVHLYPGIKFIQRHFHVYIPNLLSQESVVKQAEDAGYLPKRSFEQRKRDLATIDGAIYSIAGIMAADADIAATRGYDIRKSPDILAYCFNGPDLEDWKEHLAQKKYPTPLDPQTPIAVWVTSHLRFLEDGVGRPNLPEVITAR